jgi:hypothetical protein
MLINFTGINPIEALFWTAVINGVPRVSIARTHYADSNVKKIMARHQMATLRTLSGGLRL